MDLDIIYNEDCIEGMKHIQDQSIDAIISDMPYGTTQNKWDNVVDLDALWEQYKRIIKPHGAIVLFAQCPFDKVLAVSNLKWLKYEWIWAKSNSTGFLNANHAPLKTHETILVFSPASAAHHARLHMTYNPQYFDGKPYVSKRGKVKSDNYCRYGNTTTVCDGKRYPKDIIQFASERNTSHPTEKPLKLMRFFVRTYSNEGDVVLDSFMGSGTTAVAAALENRHYIGFETNEDYYNLSVERVRESTRQKSLSL